MSRSWDVSILHHRAVMRDAVVANVVLGEAVASFNLFIQHLAVGERICGNLTKIPAGLREGVFILSSWEALTRLGGKLPHWEIKKAARSRLKSRL